MFSRRKSRTLALQLLYQIEMGNGSAAELDTLVAEWPFGKPPSNEQRDFALALVHGVLGHQAELDQRIAALARHWSLERMLAVDLNLLRLAAYEIIHGGTPAPVAINEAVEIAKLFGDDNSPGFINGILDALASQQS